MKGLTVPSEDQQLEILVDRWLPQQLVLRSDISEKACELEGIGFSPDALAQFSGFIELMMNLTDYHIQGGNPADYLGAIRDTVDQSGFHSQVLFGAPTINPKVIFDTLPATESSRIVSPPASVRRAAQRLVRLSPVGVLIGQYRDDSPEGRQSPDLYEDYIPSLSEWMAPLEYGGSGLAMEDITKADYYYATRDLLRGIPTMFRLLGSETPQFEEKNFIKKLQLVEFALDLPRILSQRFVIAHEKLARYGAESISGYFSRGVVSAGGIESQLWLFAPNDRADMGYCE